ncbi:putative RNA-binding domain superfamily [Helianthus annuus]|nr:putative RNA-binding domain superfamily [Helianthus annuus]
MDGRSRAGGGGVVTKFFITNLSEGCTPWELKCGVASFGEVEGTFVAKKRDKDGRRFGFAIFKDVKDKAELKRLLRGLSWEVVSCLSILLGSRWIMVHGASRLVLRFPILIRSYGDVLGKGKVDGLAKEAGCNATVNSLVGRKFVVVPDRTVAFCDSWGSAIVGKTVDLETLVDLDRLLGIAKVGYSFIQYLGGLLVLISFGCEIDAKNFLDIRDVWGPWFSKLASWEGQSMPFEHVAWLRLLGIPLHLVDSDVFKMDLSIGRVGVLIGEVERIKDSVLIKWKDRSYRIWVEEELNIWAPDCLGTPEDGSAAGSSSLASSPVGRPVDTGSSGNPFMGDEEACMGGGLVGEDVQTHSLSNKDSYGEGPNEVCFNWQSFVDPCSGNVPNVSGNENGVIHFFKARKKSKRFRKGGPKSQGAVNLGSPSGLVDSIEKCRPKKRNRAQVVESHERAHEVVNSDPFSLDKLINQMREKRTYGDCCQSPVPEVNLNQPLNSDGVPFDANEGVAEDVSSEVHGQRILDPEGASTIDVELLDQEVRKTI